MDSSKFKYFGNLFSNLGASRPEVGFLSIFFTISHKYLYNDLPDVDLMIRTSGEERVSNFLLYEISYAEMYFPKVKFPDFNEEEFEKAIDLYNQRDRRMGGNTKWNKE